MEFSIQNNVITPGLQPTLSLPLFVKRMPKIELHIHLEGTIQPDHALQLVQKYESDSVLKTIADVKQQYRFGNLPDFLKAMQTITDYLRSPDDIRDAALNMLRHLSTQNVRYVEFDCAVYKYTLLGHSLKDILDSLHDAVMQAQSETKIEANIVINLVRRFGAEAALDTVKSVIELANEKVVGFGLSGDETKYPPALYSDAFKLAKQNGYGLTVHAGEGRGPNSIWNAINHLKIDRIDHGTRAKEDDSLLDYLVEQQIPLAMCPTSNLKLNVVSSLSEHPIKEYFNLGIPVTINSDDPAIFNSDIENEFLICADQFHFSHKDLEQLCINAARATFQPKEKKENLENNIREEFQKLYLNIA